MKSRVSKPGFSLMSTSLSPSLVELRGVSPGYPLVGKVQLTGAPNLDAAFAPEGAAVYLNRISLAPDLCLVAQSAAGDLLGYLVSHPWHDGKPPALHTELSALPVPATRWYLHDCAVAASVKTKSMAKLKRIRRI